MSHSFKCLFDLFYITSLIFKNEINPLLPIEYLKTQKIHLPRDKIKNVPLSNKD